MGGNYPMPTLITKGDVLVRIDEYYELVEGRLHSLDGFQGAGSFVAAMRNNGVLSGADLDHLSKDWFTAGSGFWVTLQKVDDVYVTGSPTQAALDHSQVAFKRAFEYALGISLGLDPGEAVPKSNGGKVDREKIKKHRRRELKVYWVCGKADGFEAQVVWSRRQVDLFLITPPISFPVSPLAQFNAAQIAVHDRGQEGMVLVTANANGPRVEHVARIDGGIAYGGARVRPGPFPAPIGAVIFVAAAGFFDDPASLLGFPREPSPLGEAILAAIEDYIGGPFEGLDQTVATVTHATVGAQSIWVRVNLTGVHRWTEPGLPRFMGWWPTDLEVDIPIAFRFALRGEKLSLEEAFWDQQTVHGQLGVKAIGRPILR